MKTVVFSPTNSIYSIVKISDISHFIPNLIYPSNPAYFDTKYALVIENDFFSEDTEQKEKLFYFQCKMTVFQNMLLRARGN